MDSSKSPLRKLFLQPCAIALVLAMLPICCSQGSSGRHRPPSVPTFPAVVPLTAAQATALVDSAALAIDASDLIVAVVDRTGRPLAVWHRDPAATADDMNKCVAVARTGAFMSSSQGPISSRTLEFISTFHFPATFGDSEDHEFVVANPGTTTIAPRRMTTGVNFTPQGPLWQIFTSNRGATIAETGLTTAETGEETEFNAGKEIPPPVKIDGTGPGPGLAYLPGGIPLFQSGRLVGAIGTYIKDAAGAPDVAAMEFTALEAASDNGLAIGGVPLEGAIFLVGVLLPYVDQSTRPPGYAVGATDSSGGTFVDIDPDTGGTQTERAGIVDAHGYLVGPRTDPLGNLTLAEVEQIVDQSVLASDNTRAAIRLPIGTACRMFIVVTNLDGLILALFRMEDAPIFSMDVSLAKARNVVYFSSAAGSAEIPFLPSGTAITNRTLSFLTQPKFPPGIDNSDVEGPLFTSLAVANQDPTQFDKQASDTPRAGLQNGVIFFPGSAPLYKAGVLVGGLGVSGDGVEEDDYVTALGHEDFEAPLDIRADQYFFQNVRIPYFKFPQNPGSQDP